MIPKSSRRLDFSCSLIYFTLAAVSAGYLVHAGGRFVFRSLDYFLTIAALFYGIAAIVTINELRKKPIHHYLVSGPQLSPATQKLVRSVAILLPIPIIAYSAFFFDTVGRFNGKAPNWAQTRVLLAIEEPLFGHQRAQKLLMYFGHKCTKKGNYVMAKRYILESVRNTQRHMKCVRLLACRERYLSNVCNHLDSPLEGKYWLEESIRIEAPVTPKH
jgi:hypothetical protein